MATTTRAVTPIQQQAIDFISDVYADVHDVSWGGGGRGHVAVDVHTGGSLVAGYVFDDAGVVTESGPSPTVAEIVQLWKAVRGGTTSPDTALALARRLVSEEAAAAHVDPPAPPQDDRALRVASGLRTATARPMRNGQYLRYTVKVKGKLVKLSHLATLGTDLSCLAGMDDNEVNRLDNSTFTDGLAAIALATELKRQFNTERVEIYVNGAMPQADDKARFHEHCHAQDPENCNCEAFA